METVHIMRAALGGAESFWLAVTNLGSDFAFIVLLSLYYWLINPRGGRTVGIFFGASILVTDGLKYAFDAPRPFHLDAALASEAAKQTAGGPGLPSGHVLVSTTIWGLAASQLRSRAFWALTGLVIVLIALSRVVLGVHFPLDVLVGLLVGAVLVAVGSRLPLPERDAPVWSWGVALAAVVAAAFVPVYATALGILAGFWLAKPSFNAPQTWPARLLFVVAGLLLVFAVYFAFRALPAEVRHLGAVHALRYVALVLTATELVPRLLRRFTGAQEPPVMLTA
ncbi:phosphatase PAP2 family protein [Deinococcus peraridilitoris]|uniref:PAP2 superfamily protein n=1 Tax=Deinococcus peraridilitoris (strain DSM 19664 / LMG 22246 / CIP 109416 / KR-200) TaxID=937777 RepID=L0A5E7_DEIPD|nr:phosphatase PAP2 family protein [Deinococcus peraridilitoris]AFZ69093.1 PAP2 superfamily protein [Deinococcus peraridilitoris DSM 19664]